MIKMIKWLVNIWDHDYTKVTPEEAAQLAEAEQNFANGDYVTDDEIDWD